MQDITTFARILSISEEMLLRIDEHYSKTFGKVGVLEEIVRENREKIHDRLEKLEIINARAHIVEAMLLKKMRRDDQMLFEYFGSPLCDTEENCKGVIAEARAIANVGNGFFLKKEKAESLLRREPPKNILLFFGARNIDALLRRFNVFEVYSALRFVEDKDWLNHVFFKQIEHARPSDFEERKIEMHVLSKEWLGAAEKKFLKKKFHNISHLKELGIIFVIPLAVDAPGEMIRIFSLLLHYLHEISFYSRLFRLYAKHPDTFAENLVSALRGDVLENVFPKEEQFKKWMMIQRYLAKEDKNDPRLFVPHVNPEAIHWMRAQYDIARLGKREKTLDLEFWRDLDYIGDEFPDELGGKRFISFNLVDNAMTLVAEKRIVKYRYHHHEALWNRLFSMYTTFDIMEELLVKNFQRGFIEL
ncbi:MAG: hypothetical protein HY445_03070 [Candidatus Niyogibacteria bacterium]|nr:hypothetical protein [Candidatus Niyogibacteria bacterium]